MMDTQLRLNKLVSHLQNIIVSADPSKEPEQLVMGSVEGGGDNTFSLDEMMTNNRPVNTLQELIYFFNEVPVRNFLIEKFLEEGVRRKTNCQYMGTYFVREKDDDSHVLVLDTDHHQQQSPKDPTCFSDVIRQKRSFLLNKKGKKTLFTMAILYKVAAIHFVSFLYDPVQQRIVSFDPGNNLYHNGSRVLIPNCVDAFVGHHMIPHQDHVVHTGMCKDYFHGRRYGPQYNGEDPRQTELPADKFCQSWSLRFVLFCILNDGKHDFVHEWCKIRPRERENSMMTEFFIPILSHFAHLRNQFKINVGPEHLKFLMDKHDKQKNSTKT